MAQDNIAIARPYAEAILNRALETHSLDRWSDTLEFLGAVLQSPDIIRIIADPKIPSDQTIALLLDIVSSYPDGGEGSVGGVDEEGQNLLRILAENHRLAVVPEIINIFAQLKREQQGILQVQIRSAYALGDEQTNILAAALKKRLHRDIEICSEQDPELIGGVVIHAGDLVIDGSVRGQLNRLANQLRL